MIVRVTSVGARLKKGMEYKRKAWDGCMDGCVGWVG